MFIHFFKIIFLKTVIYENPYFTKKYVAHILRFFQVVRFCQVCSNLVMGPFPTKSGHFCKNDKNTVCHQYTRYYNLLKKRCKITEKIFRIK